MLKQLRVVNARRTRGHARETTQAEIHLIRKSFRRFEFSIGNRAHKRNPAAWTISLEFRGIVRGARRQAQTAVHALLQDGIIEICQVTHEINQTSSRDSKSRLDPTRGEVRA